MRRVRQAYLWVAFFASGVLLQACASTGVNDKAMVLATDAAGMQAVDAPDGALRVMTLNVAHGRGTGFHQLLQGTGTTVGNLDRIASLLARENIDVVALQEADGPSFWSGNFCHVNYLAEKGAFAWQFHGEHVGTAGLSYGTALVSRYRPGNAESVVFDPALSLTRKGFVVSTIDWPGRPGMQVDLVSVHLAFESERARRAQARELVDVMRRRGRPMVMMGDFNTALQREDSALQYIALELGLETWLPGAEAMQTFPSNGARLDWILLSGELQFNAFRVLDDEVSDHSAVVAEIIPSHTAGL